jgi:hypothetical protein
VDIKEEYLCHSLQFRSSNLMAEASQEKFNSMTQSEYIAPEIEEDELSDADLESVAGGNGAKGTTVGKSSTKTGGGFSTTTGGGFSTKGSKKS